MKLPPPGSMTHCLQDLSGQVWNHPDLPTLKAWVARRNELLAVLATLPREPFRCPSPGFGAAVPSTFRP